MVAEVGLPITGIQDLRNMPAVARADGAPIEGILHDEEYTGAKTNGDGACGLHSLWGQVDGRAGELFARNIRQRLHACMSHSSATIES